MSEEEGPSTGGTLPGLQARVQEFWDRTGLPAKLLAGAPDGPVFRFTEGPPTANGNPHVGHLISRALKDTVLRYHRMRGERIVSSMAGWDCHGLPVELEVEKRRGLRSHRDIESYGVAKFCEECRTGALEVAAVWVEMSRRMGYSLDYEHAYRTMDPRFIESVWWALQKLYERGLLDKGHYVLPYCPRCETSLSSHEVAQGYHETTDPSVTVRLRVHGASAEPPRYLLVWTTTPWTLPANLLVAARADLRYVGVRGEDGLELILAEEALPRYFPGATPEVLHRYTGRDLADDRYDPPFPYAGPGPNRYRVVLDDSVDPKEGTGLVHIAPSFGPEDFRIGEREGVGVLDPLDNRASFGPLVAPVAGKNFKAADPVLLGLLRESGVLYRERTIRHTYPFCWRCGTPLLYRALDSWFVRTRRLTAALVANNATVVWNPAHLRDGRFGNFLTEAKDWALSRARYWGTPLPIWTCPEGHRRCVGSFAELGALAGRPLPADFDPHRVGVDALAVACPECSAPMQREPYTIDAWFDSGSAPFAQYHYPFEPGPFDPKAPLDAVAEGLDQTRGWFYAMLVIATALFERPAYRASVTNGLILDADGQKMSKSKGNAVEPLSLLERLGGDASRWGLYLIDFTEPIRFSEPVLRTAAQRTLATAYHAAEFYRENAPTGAPLPVPGRPASALDRWMVSRTNSTIARASAAMDTYDFQAAALAIQELVSDLSTWYVRRSRERFWSEEDTADRREGNAVLAGTLAAVARLLAPFAPFTAEALYQSVGGFDFADPARSVHGERWPTPGPVDPPLETAMEGVRAYVEAGRELRQRVGVKSRIPLPTLVLRTPAEDPVRALGAGAEALLRGELNVVEVRWETPGATSAYPDADWVSASLPTGVLFLTRAPTPELLREGLLREALRRLQSARKELRLAYTERIRLELWADPELASLLGGAVSRLERELLTNSPRIAPGSPPESLGVLRWSFEGHELAARIFAEPAAP